MILKLGVLVVLVILLVGGCAITQIPQRQNFIQVHANLVQSKANINNAKAGAIEVIPELAVEVTDVDNTKVGVRNYNRTYTTKKRGRVKTSSPGEDFFNKK
ncbi:hypothetical protein L6278_02175 [Candidatus Parcubacteria bacterium]|nr:hypothetical protein [Patescibacteria group bacterium]MCG2686925.1 hypothetical protein [Candidatus Parcubacteria bacterium]